MLARACLNSVPCLYMSSCITLNQGCQLCLGLVSYGLVASVASCLARNVTKPTIRLCLSVQLTIDQLRVYTSVVRIYSPAVANKLF